MANACLFCSIAEGKIPAKIIAQSSEYVVFRDINPMAPTHFLVIPRKHISTLDELTPEDGPLMGRLLQAASEVARAEGIAEGGYRTVINCRADAGQTVFHLHLHVLGGRALDWPPG